MGSKVGSNKDNGNTIPLYKLSLGFFALKFLQLIIVIFTPGQFDTSSQLITDEIYSSLSSDKQFEASSWLPFLSTLTLPAHEFCRSILDKFIIWDTVYFNDLFVNEIKYEHQFVFCPSWWRLIKYFPWGSTYYDKLSLSLLISNTCHYISFIILYYLTRTLFPANFTTKNSKFLYLSSLLFIFSPAGIFLTAGYSENLCNLLSLLTIYLHEISINYSDFKQANNKSVKYPLVYILSGSILAVNFTVRANSALLGTLYLYDLYEFGRINKSLSNSIWAIITGSQLFFSMVALNIHSYLLFCPGRVWCTYNIPLLFSYAQNHYWNVGFLHYWTPNNVPNFLFALPVIVINIASIRYFLIELPRLKKLASLIIVNILLLIGDVFFWNVQILTRISSFLPLSYWYIAILLTNDPNNKFAKYCVYYMLIWNLVQSSLFAAFLPPA